MKYTKKDIKEAIERGDDTHSESIATYSYLEAIAKILYNKQFKGGK